MKTIYKLLTTSSLSLAIMASSFAQSGALKPSTYSTDPAKSAGFTTTDFEAWNYQKVTSTGAQQNLPFRMAKPIGYSASAPAYPLIIMLHGRGEAGTDNNKQLSWGGKEAIAAIKNKTFDGFAVFPQEPYGAWTNGPAFKSDGSQPSMALTQVWDLVDSLANRFNIDRNRVYLHGLSSGGTGVWASLYYRADLFAAVQIMSSPGDISQAYNVAATPLWLHQGGIDDNPVPSVSHDVMASLRNAGAVNPANTKYTEYPNVAHTCWINAYANTDFFPFFLRQTRKKIKVLGINPYPAGSSVSLGVNSKMAAYQWFVNGSAISGATNFRLDNLTQVGTYTVMFKPKASDQWITSDPLNVGVNNSPNITPTISFTSPMNNSSYTAPGKISFRTNPADQDGLVSKVEFYSGSTLLYTTSYEPYDFTWSNVPIGNYSITAKVTDNVGGTSTANISVSVNNLSNQLPMVNITSPENNGAYNAPSNIVISVDAADYDGKIVKVDIYSGTTLLTTKQWAPYTHYFYNVPAGSYSYVAVATDDKGATKTSSPVNFTIGTNANPAPVVSITSPSNNSTYASPANINITANASDADGISKVEFYNGISLIGTSTSAPYQFNWTSVAGGSYTIIAKAYDTKGGIGSSSGINISVSGGTSNQLPVTSITSPANNATMTPNTTYTISADASDADGSVTKVEFYRGTTLLGTDTYPPFYYTVYGQAAGSYSFTAKAFDNQGGTTVSAAVNVTFGQGDNSNTPPTVSLTSPANNAGFTAPANINLTANANDADGISKVEFYNGTSLIGTASNAPYQFNWTNVSGGSYTIIAKAFDTKGGVASSAGTNVTVAGPSNNESPITSVTSPANNATMAPNTTYTITANASDADGLVTKVEFYRGTALLGTDTYAPYSYTVYGQAAGSFSFTTKAYDNQGGVTVSTPVNVTFGGQEFFDLNASCLASGQTYSITLKPEFTTNATKYAWWYTGTGLSITPVAGQPNASLNATSSVTSGEICVGVNYSTTPSYKQYCKAINKCAQNRVDNSLAESSVIIDPTNNTYQVTANREVTSVSVVDINGQILYTGNNMEQGQTVDFNKLPNGVYIVNVLYSDGSKEVKHMPKVK